MQAGPALDPGRHHASRRAPLQQGREVAHRCAHQRRVALVAGQAGAHREDALLLGHRERPRAGLGGHHAAAFGQEAGPGVGRQAVLRRGRLGRREAPGAGRGPPTPRSASSALAVAQRHRVVVAGRRRPAPDAAWCAPRVGANRRRKTMSGGRPGSRLRSIVRIMPGTKVSTVSPPRSPRPEAMRTPSVGGPASKSSELSSHSPCTNLAARWSWPSDFGSKEVWQLVHCGAQAVWQLEQLRRSWPPPWAQTAACGLSGAGRPSALRRSWPRPWASTVTLSSASPLRVAPTRSPGRQRPAAQGQDLARFGVDGRRVQRSQRGAGACMAVLAAHAQGLRLVRHRPGRSP